MSKSAQSVPKGDVDAVIAEVESVRAAGPSPAVGAGATAMPPGWEDLAMQVFIFLLNWWKSRTP